jgi:hypothetical protein
MERMKKILLLSLVTLLVAPWGNGKGKDPWDKPIGRAFDVVLSSPEVIQFWSFMAENTKGQKYPRPHMRIENDETDWKKGEFDVYVGMDTGDMTQRHAAYKWDGNKRELTGTIDVVDWEYEPKEFNELLFAKIEVDSSFKGYSSKPITDSNYYKKEIVKAAERAWASAETDQEHWVQATFDKPVTLRKAMLFWAWDKGKYFGSQSIKILYNDASGHETEVKGLKSSNRVTQSKDYLLPGADQCQTQWTFEPAVTDRLIFRQAKGGGSPARPNLMWISQVWAY